jgi:lysophospholipase L1-like esterase
LALFTACEPKIDEFKVDKGSANFSTYVAVGNSLSAGYADGALYNTGQKNSLPNILAGQFKLVGAGNFVQPMVTSDYGLGIPGFPAKFILAPKADCNGKVSLSPIRSTGSLDPFLPVGYQVNNLAVPGMKSFHMFAPGYGSLAGLVPPIHANPYYVRFCSEPNSPTFKLIDELPKLNPTFFTFWLGDNDVLGYAIAGGVGDSITATALFQQAILGSLQALTAGGAKGAVANIPDVTTIPYFTTIPYNGLVLTQEYADMINFAMKNIYMLPFTYKAGANPFLVEDPTSSHPVFKVRQMEEGELVLLSVPQDALKCGGMGIISVADSVPYPIPNEYVLTKDEITKIKSATTDYNSILVNAAQTFNLAFVDMNSKLKELNEKGIVWDGIKMNTKFISGGAFSLDGIHLTPRGCAVSANYFIDAINAKYGSTIPWADVTKYNGIIFP